jgi:hypothetical protein
MVTLEELEQYEMDEALEWLELEEYLDGQFPEQLKGEI